MSNDNTFLRLSDLSSEERISLEKGLSEIYTTGINGITLKKPFKEFDENGLKYPMNHLRNIGLSIIMLPIEWMSKYVDEVTVNLVRYAPEELLGSSFLYEYDKLNATSIGNLAYVSLNVKNEDFVQKSNELLHKIFVDFNKEIIKYKANNSSLFNLN
ncbi:hypothetical protein [Tenacibaculum finnmarkense]|uniref:hypothetical protein n=1 Tax=Tenacibaculum finnmarkense TaxID=2781243 RepID=UPI000C4FD1BD|nr:hypothetical protein [Tenacibaculum finnmarkense]MCG8208181.1 hypothetical protein [Tenacibaculum finnmarkense genomovar finnmarkense]MCG8742508.1 hypothetical protein [Tenacibaculum finnmarkense]MCG8761067.1 hypothetical protein [Tenacibaculum finnmarkense]MCG8765908.1 hypothetical protein [Tenacibaculum finnmarkense]MCG8776287.1 hypothetical protein [Tenacibaculum finnmarkense]